MKTRQSRESSPGRSARWKQGSAPPFRRHRSPQAAVRVCEGRSSPRGLSSKGSMKKTNALFSVQIAAGNPCRLCPAWGIVVFCQKFTGEEEQQALPSDARVPKGGLPGTSTPTVSGPSSDELNSTEGNGNLR